MVAIQHNYNECYTSNHKFLLCGLKISASNEHKSLSYFTHIWLSMCECLNMGLRNQDELRKCTGSKRVSQQLSDSSAGWLQNVTVTVKLPAAEYCLEVWMSAK